jgi:hypothetical protein
MKIKCDKAAICGVEDKGYCKDHFSDFEKELRMELGIDKNVLS